MADFKTIQQENRKESSRLAALAETAEEKELLSRLPNGWTAAGTLLHIAFWDLRQIFMIQAWVQDGQKPESVLPMYAPPANYALSVISNTIPPQAAARLAAETARQADALIESLSQAQAEALIQQGFERNLHRAFHRRGHLDKIEKALKG
ncbi:MAG TPA: DinB family protein, partial [bacterium]|jgi:hypothetical protein|nr:DinB family protein [bacterium]